jgi:uncharacterized protein
VSASNRAILFAVAFAVAAASVPAVAQVAVPRNDGWVTDLAEMLEPDEERSLEALMESYRAGSGHEIALLTVPDLGGNSLERYALEVAREWGIGSTETHAGALLLVAKRERKIRIEVGRGLEGRLTDSISGRIIRDVIAPRFKRGDVYGGIRAGIEAMHAAAGGDYAAVPGGLRDTKAVGIAALLPLLFFAIVWIAIFRAARRGGRGGRGGFGGGGVLPWLVLASMSGGRGGRSSGWHSGGGGGFSGFGGGGGFSGGGASGGW